MISLAEHNPELLNEWDYKNNSIAPNIISYGSKEKVWWICNNNHSFEQSINNRTRGSKCPYCLNQKVLKGYNDFASKCPELLKEWNYSKNTIKPDEIVYKSGKKVWWICSNCNFEWKTSVVHRTGYHKTGCPECAKKKQVQTLTENIIKKDGSFANNYPQLLEDWDYERNVGIDPYSLTSKSERRVNWICKFGHRWDCVLASRTRVGSGCPICAGKKILKGFNDFESQQPVLMKEWDYDKNNSIDLKPDTFTVHSEKKAYWICPNCNYSYMSCISHRVEGTSCPRCANEMKTSFGEQAIYYYLSKLFNCDNRWNQLGYEADIFIYDLQLAIEYDGEYYHNNELSLRREQEKYEEFKSKSIPLIRVKENFKNINLKSYADYTIEINIKNYDKEIPIVIHKIIGYINMQYNTDYSVNIDLKNDRQYIYQQYIKQRRENSLAIKMPDLLDEWDYDKNKIGPESIGIGSEKKIWWKCKDGHSYEQHVSNHVKGARCPYCAGQKVLTGINDLETKFPKIANEWDYKKNKVSPGEVFPFTNKKYYWLCEKGHSYLATPNARCYEGKKTGCPICSNKIVLDGFNDLKTLKPEIAKDWDYKKNIKGPEEYSIGSDYKAWWICPFGHSYQAIINSRTNINKGTGCPICNGKKVLDGFNDLKSQRPDLLVDWNYDRNEKEGLYPDKVHYNSLKKVNWKCHVCGYEWKAPPYSRSTEGKGCNTCGYKRAGYKRRMSIIKEQGSFVDNYPELIKDWDYELNTVDPNEMTAGSHKMVNWKCHLCEHKWKSEIRGRAKGTRCPGCNHKPNI